MRKLFSVRLLAIIVSSAEGEAVWTRYLSASLIPDISCEGDYIWLANSGGVVKLNRHSASSIRFTTRDGLADNSVSVIYLEWSGRKWFVTGDGVYRFDGVSWQKYGAGVGLFGDWVRSIAVDLNNVKWFAGFDTGIISFDDRAATLVEENVPALYALSNHPNPFNPSTAIIFSLPSPGRATLAVYSITGQKIRELVSEQLSAEKHTVVWDGKDFGGQAVASGVYFSRLEAHGRSETSKMLLMR